MASVVIYTDTKRAYIDVPGGVSVRSVIVYKVTEDDIVSHAPGWTLVWTAGYTQFGEPPVESKHVFTYSPDDQENVYVTGHEYVFRGHPAIGNVLLDITSSYVPVTIITSTNDELACTVSSAASDPHKFTCPSVVYMSATGRYVATVQYVASGGTLTIDDEDDIGVALSDNVIYAENGAVTGMFHVTWTADANPTDTYTWSVQIVSVESGSVEDVIPTHNTRVVGESNTSFELGLLPWGDPTITHILIHGYSGVDETTLAVSGLAIDGTTLTVVPVVMAVDTAATLSFVDTITRVELLVIVSRDNGLSFLTRYTLAFDSKRYLAHCLDDKTLRYCQTELDPEWHLSTVILISPTLQQSGFRDRIVPAPGWAVTMADGANLVTFTNGTLHANDISMAEHERGERCMAICVMPYLESVTAQVGYDVSGDPGPPNLELIPYDQVSADTEWTHTRMFPRTTYTSANTRAIVGALEHLALAQNYTLLLYNSLYQPIDASFTIISNHRDPIDATLVTGEHHNVSSVSINDHLTPGVYFLHYVPTNAQMSDTSVCVICQQFHDTIAGPTLYLDGPDDRISLSRDMFESQDGAPVTHVNITLPRWVALYFDPGPSIGVSPPDITFSYIFPISAVDDATMGVLDGYRQLPSTRSTDFIITYQTSTDHMGSFVSEGTIRLSVLSVPPSCVDGDARVRMWSHNVIYRQITECTAGDRIASHTGHCRTITSIRSFWATTVVRLPVGCLGPNRPSRQLFITPHHRVIYNNRPEPAGRLLIVCPEASTLGASIIPWHRRVFHVETDEPCFMMVDGLLMETFSKTRRAVF